MKKILIAITLLLSMNSFAGVFLTCASHYDGGFSDGQVWGAHTILGGELNLNCQDTKGEIYSIDMKGIGPGLEFNNGAGIAVVCPTVSKKRLNSKGQVVLGAANVSASAIIGATAGIALNHRGGTCLVTGFTSGLGASVKIGYIKIMTGSLRSNGIEPMIFF